MNNNKKILNLVFTCVTIILSYVIVDVCMNRIGFSGNPSYKILAFMVVFLLLNSILSVFRNEGKTEELKTWYVILAQLSEEEKDVLKQMVADGDSHKAMRKVQEISGASILEAKQYVDSLQR